MTKSYNYIPTHFLYSSLLFFLLIFMHQLIRCHALIQPFSKIFFFRIYVPTTYTHQPCLTLISTRPVAGLRKHPRPYSPRKPIHQRPQTPTQPTNQTTANFTPIQPHKPIHHNAHTAPYTLDAEPAPVDVDADDAPTMTQPRLRQQLDRPGI